MPRGQSSIRDETWGLAYGGCTPFFELAPIHLEAILTNKGHWLMFGGVFDCVTGECLSFFFLESHG